MTDGPSRARQWKLCAISRAQASFVKLRRRYEAGEIDAATVWATMRAAHPEIEGAMGDYLTAMGMREKMMN